MTTELMNTCDLLFALGFNEFKAFALLASFEPGNTVVLSNKHKRNLSSETSLNVGGLKKTERNMRLSLKRDC